MTIQHVGIWLDRAWARLRRDGLLERLVDLPAIGEWCLMLGASDSDDLDGEWTARDLGALAQVAADAGVRLVGTVWIRPTRTSIEQLGDVARQLRSVGAIAIELEAEGNWQTSRVRGYADLDEAARAVRDVLGAAAPGLPVQATIHLGRLNQSLTAWSSHDTVQAYSADDDGDAREAWGGDLGPGWRQVLGYQRLTEIHCGRDYPRLHDVLYTRGLDPADVPGLIREHVADGHLRPASDWGGLGLPLWGQGPYPGHEHVAMQVAWDTAEALGCSSVRYWSAKWIEKNDYAEGWLRSLPVDRRARRLPATDPGRDLYERWVRMRIAADNACVPIAPWSYLSVAERAAWQAVAAGQLSGNFGGLP